MAQPDEWRLPFAESVKGKTLRGTPDTKNRARHGTEGHDPEYLPEGYATLEDDDWVCPQCVDDLNDVMDGHLPIKTSHYTGARLPSRSSQSVASN